MRKSKWGIIVFPGSNCDYDCWYVIKEVFSQEVEFVWHKEKKDLSIYDFVILPGGFSYGDYLRAGTIARFSIIMKSIEDYAERGGIILGICNGFQILCESGLLEGALLRNKNLRFICRYVFVRVENTDSIFTRDIKKRVLRIPIAHIAGNYFVTPEVFERLNKENRILFRYSDEEGNVNEESNPNGSVDNIAGIINKRGNILGMMPHPERACEYSLGSKDGIYLFLSLINHLKMR